MNTKLMNRLEDLFLKYGIKFNQLDLIDLTNELDQCINQQKIHDLEAEITKFELAHEKELNELEKDRDYWNEKCDQLEQELEDERNKDDHSSE